MLNSISIQQYNLKIIFIFFHIINIWIINWYLITLNQITTELTLNEMHFFVQNISDKV